MERLAPAKPVPRELNPDECQQVSGSSLELSSLSDFHPIAWPRILVAIDPKQIAVQVGG